MGKRQMKEIRRESLNYELDGSLEKGLGRINDIAEQLRVEGATEIAFDTDSGGYYDDGVQVFLVGSRPETDDEQHTREEGERRAEEIRRDYQRREFERLKKVFEE